MRIAQIAPLWKQVPPPAYGGTELIVSSLTDELVRRGHNVTIALDRGAALEVIAHGKTGFLCQSVEDCIAALKQVAQLDRALCRSWVSQHFSVQQMVDGYEAVYRQILSERLTQNGKSSLLIPN